MHTGIFRFEKILSYFYQVQSPTFIYYYAFLCDSIFAFLRNISNYNILSMPVALLVYLCKYINWYLCTDFIRRYYVIRTGPGILFLGKSLIPVFCFTKILFK